MLPLRTLGAPVDVSNAAVLIAQAIVIEPVVMCGHANRAVPNVATTLSVRSPPTTALSASTVLPLTCIAVSLGSWPSRLSTERRYVPGAPDSGSGTAPATFGAGDAG